MYATTISCSVALFLIIMFLFLVRKNLIGLLKDQSAQEVANAPYSLSRTILFFWTLILFLSICYIGITTDNLVPLTKGVLILMGIVVGTTAVGKTIDSSQSATTAAAANQAGAQPAAQPAAQAVAVQPVLIQDMPSQNFLTDILSDRNGISISRLQTVIFNIIYGCVFVSYVISQDVLYNFPPETLTLLGISSGGYALMKIPENS